MKFRIGALVWPLILFSLPDCAHAQSKAAQDRFEASRAAVVKVVVEGADDNGAYKKREGTGFIVFSRERRTIILTARHVIGSNELRQSDNKDWQVVDRKIKRDIHIMIASRNGTLTQVPQSARLVPSTIPVDIAILEIRDLDALPSLSIIEAMSDFSRARDVVLLGFESGSYSLEQSLGDTSGKFRSAEEFETEKPSKPGQSGGPWVDVESGKVAALAQGENNDHYVSTPAFYASKDLKPLIDAISSPAAPGATAPSPPTPAALPPAASAPPPPNRATSTAQLPLPTKQSCSQIAARVALGRMRTAHPLSLGEECSLSPGDEFSECENCPIMVVIPRGEFWMGSPDGEDGRSRDEGPRHPVTISKNFAIGKYPIKVDEYKISEAAEATAKEGYCRKFRALVDQSSFKEDKNTSWKTPGFPQDGRYPVTCLNRGDAIAYTQWLSKTTAAIYRLPTEAEWEYAARGRSQTPKYYTVYYFGNDPDQMCQHANTMDQTTAWPQVRDAAFQCNDGFKFTAPVGSYLPNPFGLYDIHGNVLQWVADCYHSSYRGAPPDGSPWGNANCEKGVLRGGSWALFPSALRDAFRRSNDDRREAQFGLRVVRELKQ
ncbi:SUMF1/EgtB/PvdO family nonheme iron enzyme [Bradyrhizobium sp. 151]|uniref:SUMF1/EgtB/PvdO family nonheme iron enzyme n=1 Tax=Bradyrhizobium sp. 151 TaxID=2782626 RepID=UPI001FFABC70|nr:SUMF1/EgtB/PvdO family nonheme iron enzyme [Bradyrhizobium sp. 151]MCK1658593.1 SUMF1/EgtB/PvdO family nonheme iron enzyme [Bradyrhizobium sp. 151]